MSLNTPTSEDLTSLVSRLTLEEKISLLSGVDWWRTPTIRRDGLFVPHLKVCIDWLTPKQLLKPVAAYRWTEWRSRRELCEWNQGSVLPLWDMPGSHI